MSSFGPFLNTSGSFFTNGGISPNLVALAEDKLSTLAPVTVENSRFCCEIGL
jgi:hypothetical protein